MKIANTHEQVLWHFGVGTWKQWKKLKIVTVKINFLWSTGRRNSTTWASGVARLVWTGRVRCETRHVRCVRLVLTEFAGSLRMCPVWTGHIGATPDASDVCVRCCCHFAELSAHASDMDRTRPVWPSCESNVVVSGEHLLAITDRFQTVESTGWCPGNTGRIRCELERVRCERRQWGMWPTAIWCLGLL